MIRSLTLAALLATAAALSAPSPALAGEIKIGDINSYKRLPAHTEPYKKGATLAIEEINAAGGVLGDRQGRDFLVGRGLDGHHAEAKRHAGAHNENPRPAADQPDFLRCHRVAPRCPSSPDIADRPARSHGRQPPSPLSLAAKPQ